MALDHAGSLRVFRGARTSNWHAGLLDEAETSMQSLGYAMLHGLYIILQQSAKPLMHHTCRSGRYQTAAHLLLQLLDCTLEVFAPRRAHPIGLHPPHALRDAACCGSRPTRRGLRRRRAGLSRCQRCFPAGPCEVAWLYSQNHHEIQLQTGTRSYGITM